MRYTQAHCTYSSYPMLYQLVVVGWLTLECCVLSSCGVNLSAVNDFATESSLISSNKAILDDTSAQTELWSSGNHTKPVVDPKSREFTDTLAVTNLALKALNGYMTVLAQLSAKGVADVSSDFSTIGTALQSLNVTDPAVQSGLSATSALTNILLETTVRNDIKKLLVAGAEPVDHITTYLADEARVTGSIYSQAIAASNVYWGNLTQQTPEDIKLCRRVNICRTVYVLADRAREADDKDLNAKARAADAAAKAFQKIHDDNAALVSHVDHLGSGGLVEILTNDEPYLLTAIHSMKAI